MSPTIIAIALVVGILLGTLFLGAVLWIYIRDKKIGWGGIFLCLIGVILLGLSLWGTIEISISASGIKAKFNALETRVNTVQDRVSTVQDRVSTVQNMVKSTDSQVKEFQKEQQAVHHKLRNANRDLQYLKMEFDKWAKNAKPKTVPKEIPEFRPREIPKEMPREIPEDLPREIPEDRTGTPSVIFPQAPQVE
jgi:hypothetical protein